MPNTSKKSDLRSEAWKRIKKGLFPVLFFGGVFLTTLLIISLRQDISIFSFSDTPGKLFNKQDTQLYAELLLTKQNISSWDNLVSTHPELSIAGVKQFIAENLSIQSEQDDIFDGKRLGLAIIKNGDETDKIFFLEINDRQEITTNLETIFGDSKQVFSDGSNPIYLLENHGLFYSFWKNYILISYNKNILVKTVNNIPDLSLQFDPFFKSEKNNYSEQFLFSYFKFVSKNNSDASVPENIILGYINKNMLAGVLNGEIKHNGISFILHEENKTTSAIRPILGLHTSMYNNFPKNTSIFIQGYNLKDEVSQWKKSSTNLESDLDNLTSEFENKYELSLQEDILPLFSENYAIGKTSSGWLLAFRSDYTDLSAVKQQLIKTIRDNYAVLNPLAFDTVFPDGKKTKAITLNTNNIKIQEEEINGILVQSFPLSGLPVFATAQINDNLLLIGTSTGAINLGISSFRGQIDSMNKNEDFIQINKTFGNNMDSIIYLNKDNMPLKYFGLPIEEKIANILSGLGIASNSNETKIFLLVK